MIFYLCDGNVENCNKCSCYKNGGECRYTSDISHAINSIGHNKMISKGEHYFEIENSREKHAI